MSSETKKGKLVLSNTNFGDHRIFTDNEASEIDKYNGKDVRRIIDIDLITLDELVSVNEKLNEVSFICMDIQGFELEALKGGKNFLSKGIPMLFELDPYLLEKKGATKENLFNEIKSHYNLFVDVLQKEEYKIESFPVFYESLKKSSQQHRDILLIS